MPPDAPLRPVCRPAANTYHW